MGNEDLFSQSAIELKRRIATKQISPVELVEKSISRQEGFEPKLNAFVTTTPDVAREAAKRAERAVMAGEELGLLHGLPITIKDTIPVAGSRFTMGSRVFAEEVAKEDAPAVERIRYHGACIIGKTTTPEFGSKLVGDSPLTGITRNPWDLKLTPGGSSSGAAASVAVGITPLALGTDGGGSIRVPAAFTGVFGIKPQFARIPIYPSSVSPTLSHVGCIGRNVRDVALLLMAVSGYDPRDAFSVAEPTPDFLGACDMPVEGMRIAWSPRLGYAEIAPEVLACTESAVRHFEEFGCKVELVDDVFAEDPIAIWRDEIYSSMSVGLASILENSAELLDPVTLRVLSEHVPTSLFQYHSSVLSRNALRDRMRRFFEQYDLLVTPTVPVLPFEVAKDVPTGIPDEAIIQWAQYTYPFNLTGHPAASLPAGFSSEGLPVGLQIVSRQNREIDIFRLAAALEKAQPWQHRKPPLWE